MNSMHFISYAVQLFLILVRASCSNPTKVASTLRLHDLDSNPGEKLRREIRCWIKKEFAESFLYFFIKNSEKREKIKTQEEKKIQENK